jgi:hypothetical protein
MRVLPAIILKQIETFVGEPKSGRYQIDLDAQQIGSSRLAP